MQKTAGGDDAATTWAYLPRHVQSEILLRLPAFQLRRLRRVCKLWRDIITDAHKLRLRRAPTHTIAFYKGCDAGPGNVAEMLGHGFLFDEQWRLAARFTVDRSAILLGTCNSLLCFFHEHDGIKVVDPLSGASIRVPLSPAKHGSKTWREYCFGFDSTTRQYKIVHVHRYKLGAPPSKDGVFVEKELHVHTVGADKQGWRAVRIDTALHGVPYNKDGGFAVEKNPAYGNDAVYWLGITAGRASKNVRFDLATEEITSADEPLLQVRGQMPATQICCRYQGAKLGLCGIQITWYGEWEDGCWPHNFTALPHKTTAVRYNSSYHRLGRLFGRRLPGAHALQRGHLLLQEPNGTLYAHEIGSSSACMTELRLVGKKKPLVYTGRMEEPADQWYKFVPLRSHQRQRLAYPRWHNSVSTFAYSPTLPPLGSYALHFGSSNVLPL